ncbi:YkvA family protein [Bacillus coahuilensis]|uniref:YkvA family protein n=1 Tax=Bacillus coahuilensis TaxID=408580 RepID=UPI0009EAF37B|nr:DUF1232 domain-containing protein [Bacillus coahuilensis]
MIKLFKRLKFMTRISKFLPFLKDYYLSKEVTATQKIVPLLLVAGYILLPIDIIPDFLSVFGIVDDLTLLTFLFQRVVGGAPASIREKYDLEKM